MSSEPTKYWTFEEYLAWEELQAEKHEFYDGVLFDEAGSPFAHNRIVINLHLLLAKQFHNSISQTIGPDIKVLCPSGFIATPDIIVLKEPPIFTTTEMDVITNPSILIDVFTPESSDSKGGTLHYEMIKIKSLSYYVVISQERPDIEIFHRLDNRNARISTHTSGTCKLESSVGSFEICFEDVYQGVTFPALKWFNGPRKLVQ